jgi:signal transduction histidine kinase
MRSRSLILILLIVGIPLGVLILAAVRLARNEQVVVQQQFHDLMEQRLQDVNRGIASHFQRTEAELEDLTSVANPDEVTLRAMGRTEPKVMQMFLLTPDGRLQYPNLQGPLNGDEQRFLTQAARVFSEQHLMAVSIDTINSNDAMGIPAPSAKSDVSDTVETQASEFANTTRSANTGWLVWYWDRGLNLIYWNRRPSGQIVGAALDRSRWISDLIGQLPDRQFADSSSSSSSSSQNAIVPRIQLVDAAAEPIYQWGQAADDATEVVCEIAIAAPLASWRLKCLLPPGEILGQSRGSFAGIAGGLIAVGIAVAILAFVLIRDYSRDMREAGQQVSFVNQVSHELKTPLTNIRLYAELLEKDLDSIADETSQPIRKRLNVILSEGQRLSRLIGNVLTVARENRDSLQLNRVPCVPDAIIQQVLNYFEPALSSLNVRIETDLNAIEQIELDSDFLEQMLGNLISNVEKYASTGESLTVRSQLNGDTLVIDIIDDGPGIPVHEHARVFEPFVRISQDISSAAGTGIGLSICRKLAREHGGNVRIATSKSGCHFEVTLKVGR